MPNSDIIVPDKEQEPDFRLFFTRDVETGQESPLKTVKYLGEGRWEESERPGEPLPDFPCIRGIGSSEIMDTDGDEMRESALKSMCTASHGMSIWMNHDYTVPGSLFGGLIEQPKMVIRDPDGRGAIKARNKYAAVEIFSDVEDENEEALKSYRMIRKGRQFGFSVGCLYTDYERKRDGRGALKGIIVKEVAPIEWSVVGIPANQQSWIESVHKSMVKKGVLPANDDLEVAYVLNHWDHFESVDPVLANTLRQLQKFYCDAYQEDPRYDIVLATRRKYF